jgi:hypothetical protein
MRWPSIGPKDNKEKRMSLKQIHPAPEKKQGKRKRHFVDCRFVKHGYNLRRAVELEGALTNGVYLSEVGGVETRPKAILWGRGMKGVGLGGVHERPKKPARNQPADAVKPKFWRSVWVLAVPKHDVRSGRPKRVRRRRRINLEATTERCFRRQQSNY